MCGRYTIRLSKEDYEEHFGVEFPAQTGRYNVAPSQEIPVYRDVEGVTGFGMLKWGLIPSWSKEPKVNFSNINARRETVATTNAFRAAFKRRRCLIAADGFFEWYPGPPKVPHYFQIEKGRPFAFAGLWERWGESLDTCAIITTEANELVAPTHGRMPVILHPADYARWLDLDAPLDELQSMLAPYRGPMKDTAVGTYVNSPKNQGPKCVEPAIPT